MGRKYKDKRRKTTFSALGSTFIPDAWTKPFLRVPVVVDYCEATDYIVYGETIPQPPVVEHPRKYKIAVMPEENADPWTCRHSFCEFERKRLVGFPVGLKPKGLPWASGLLPYLPGKVQYEYPLKKAYLTYPEKKPRAKRPKLTQKEKQMECVIEEMILFYKLILLAGLVIDNLRKEMAQEEDYYKEEDAEGKEENKSEIKSQQSEAQVQESEVKTQESEAKIPESDIKEDEGGTEKEE